MLPNDNANNVITNVAVASASNPLMSDKDFDDIVNREVQKEYAKMRTQNKTTVFAGNTKYDEHINNYAMMYGIDPLLVKAVIKQESGFNPNAESSAGAVGLMQLMPATARSLGVKNAKDPKQNIAGGTKYLASLLKQFDGNIPLALSAYNAGAGTVKKYGNKIPPYKETQNYVKNIMATYNSIKG
ncbi:MAG: lytic transglycosylase domain-containing protein [Clostridia bacterium]|nr:lytic transglycosylase domain-containing protein [Clostridia bacterium]